MSQGNNWFSVVTSPRPISKLRVTSNKRFQSTVLRASSGVNKTFPNNSAKRQKLVQNSNFNKAYLKCSRHCKPKRFQTTVLKASSGVKETDQNEDLNEAEEAAEKAAA